MLKQVVDGAATDDVERFREALAPLVEAIGAELLRSGDTGSADVELEWAGTVVGVRLPALHGALERLISLTEDELGGPLDTLSREEKQHAVAKLDDLGAFRLRRSVEDVADALGVSRFTVYNYLNAVAERRDRE